MSHSSNPEIVRPGSRRPHRVVVLCADGPLHRHTCATLLRAGVQVVGIVVCTREGFGAYARFLRRWATRHGLTRTGGQILGRLYDRAKNGRRDAQMLAQLVDDAANSRCIDEAAIPVVRTDSYSRPATIAAIRSLDPDILVVHSKFIVGPAVRRLARVVVIGGHPGITPQYRGAYSPFWALLHGQPEMVGFTVFVLDDGIDTGPIVQQGSVPIERGEDSHLTLAWKGMLKLAELQASAIRQLDAGSCIPVRAVRAVPDNSYFGPPTLREFWTYGHRQQMAR